MIQTIVSAKVKMFIIRMTRCIGQPTPVGTVLHSEKGSRRLSASQCMHEKACRQLSGSQCMHVFGRRQLSAAQCIDALPRRRISAAND